MQEFTEGNSTTTFDEFIPPVRNIVQLAQSARLVLRAAGYKSEMGEDYGALDPCGLSIETVKLIGEKSGMNVDGYQIEHINKARGIYRPHSFGHAFEIVTQADGKKFLVDLTFPQFLDPKTKTILQKQPWRVETDISISDPIADRLQKDGYIPLNQFVYGHYLDMTTDVKRANKATLEQLNHVTPIRSGSHSNQDIGRYFRLAEVFSGAGNK